MNFDIALLSSWSTRPSIARLIFRAVSSSVTVFMCPSRSAQASFSRFIASTPLMVLKMARGNRLVAHVFTLFTPSCSVDVTVSFEWITRLFIMFLSSSVSVLSSVNFLITSSRPDWNALRKKSLSAAWKNEIIEANPKMSARDPVIWSMCRTYFDCDLTSSFRCLKKVVMASSRIMSYSYFD